MDVKSVWAAAHELPVISLAEVLKLQTAWLIYGSCVMKICWCFALLVHQINMFI